jgi:PAS domain S-box-containing protein
VVASVKDYAIFMLDASGHVATWNAGAEVMKGYRAEEVVGKPISIFYTPEDLALGKPQALLAAAVADGRVEDEGWRVRKDGSRFWADVVVTPVSDSGGQLQGFVKVTRDLTARKHAEDRLRQSEESMRATLYSIGDGVLAADERGRVTRINPVAERLTGWLEGEALARPIEEIFHIVNEETRAAAINPVARVLAEGVVVGLANHTALISRDGSERPIADSGAPIFDSQGKAIGAVLVFRDITEQRKVEEKQLRLAQAQEAIRLRDEFLSIASHELKTPLTALQVQLGTIRTQIERGNVLEAKVERALRITSRLAQLIETLLDVSRFVTGKLKLNLEAFDMVEAIGDVVERFRESAAGAGCALAVQARGPVEGRWDRLRVEQVFTNLIANAIKYASGKPIAISAERRGDEAILEVRDHGPGIADVDLPRIFERFERAAPMRHYSGLGLGLYVARQIAEAHAGSIAARNPPDGGASFTVRLPVEPPPAPP